MLCYLKKNISKVRIYRCHPVLYMNYNISELSTVYHDLIASFKFLKYFTFTFVQPSIILLLYPFLHFFLFLSFLITFYLSFCPSILLFVHGKDINDL